MGDMFKGLLFGFPVGIVIIVISFLISEMMERHEFGPMKPRTSKQARKRFEANPRIRVPSAEVPGPREFNSILKEITEERLQRDNKVS